MRGNRGLFGAIAAAVVIGAAVGVTAKVAEPAKDAASPAAAPAKIAGMSAAHSARFAELRAAKPAPLRTDGACTVPQSHVPVPQAFGTPASSVESLIDSGDLLDSDVSDDPTTVVQTQVLSVTPRTRTITGTSTSGTYSNTVQERLVKLRVCERMDGPDLGSTLTLYQARAQDGGPLQDDPDYSVNERYLLYVRPKLDDRSLVISVSPEGRFIQQPDGSIDAVTSHGNVAETLQALPDAAAAVEASNASLVVVHDHAGDLPAVTVGATATAPKQIFRSTTLLNEYATMGTPLAANPMVADDDTSPRSMNWWCDAPVANPNLCAEVRDAMREWSDDTALNLVEAKKFVSTVNIRYELRPLGDNGWWGLAFSGARANYTNAAGKVLTTREWGGATYGDPEGCIDANGCSRVTSTTNLYYTDVDWNFQSRDVRSEDRRAVACQEVGHVFGLGHARGDCMGFGYFELPDRAVEAHTIAGVKTVFAARFS